MRSELVMISAFCMGMSLIGCNDSKSTSPGQTPHQPTAPVAAPAAPAVPVAPNPNTPTPPVVGPVAPVQPQQPSNPQVMSWTLKLQSKCPESMSEGECVGLYGFSVDQQGNFKVGPGPSGEVRTGTVKPEELAGLQDLLKTTLALPGGGGTGFSVLGAEEHLSLDGAAPSEDMIYLTQGANGSEGQKLIRTSGLDFYYTLRSGDEAKNLYTALRNLAATYYAPLPFPDACEDGIHSLQTLIASVSACKLDTDCAYFDTNLELVAPNTPDATLELDNCARVLPLSVANATEVTAQKTKIQESMATVVAACSSSGSQWMRSDCAGTTGFKLTGPTATCQQGVCKAPSTLTDASAPATMGSFYNNYRRF